MKTDAKAILTLIFVYAKHANKVKIISKKTKAGFVYLANNDF